MSIYYRAGYRFQLAQDYLLQIGIIPEKAASLLFVRLSADGYLTIKEGYAWDGATGLPGTPPCMIRGSLVHDALYQLIREGFLPVDDRDKADRLLQAIVLEDGGDHAFSEVVYQAVRLLGAVYVTKNKERPVMEAPSTVVGTPIFKDSVQ